MCGGLAHIVQRLNTIGAEYDNYNYTYLFLEVFTIYSNFIHTKTAYTLRASCDIITALSPAVSVRKRLLPNVTLSKPCSKAKRTSSIEKSPSGPTNTVISSAEEGCSSCEIAVKKSAREISG